MSDLITIFIDGGEYVNRAAYIEQRDEASELRERIERLQARIAELDDALLKEVIENLMHSRRIKNEG